jgi:hypothetical protein
MNNMNALVENRRVHRLLASVPVTLPGYVEVLSQQPSKYDFHPPMALLP